MSIVTRFRRLAYDAVKFGAAIYETPYSDTLAALNALYESLWSATAPGATGRTYWGHNHAQPASVGGSAGGAGGGGALCRGMVWGADGGETAIFDYQPSSATTSFFLTGSSDKIGRVPTSQGLNRNAYLVARVLYSAQNSDFEFDVYERSNETRGFSAANNPATNLLPQTYAASESENKTFAVIRFPLAPGRGFSQFMPVARAATYDSNNAPRLKIYSLHVWEIDGICTTRSGQRLDATQ